MNIIAVGINHKTAPISIREKFYLNSIQEDLLLSELKSDAAVTEAFVASTCNRTEVYVNVIDADYEIERVVMIICQIRGIAYNSGLMGYFYTYTDRTAVEHLMSVCAGLDSLVIGERQILGQMKTAFDKGQQKGFFLKNFNILSNVAIRAGKKAQTETDIGIGGSSISWAAIMMAERDLGSLKDKSVLMVGAGQMSKLAVGQISNRGFRQLYVMNRTEQHARDLAARFEAQVVSFCELKETLANVDLCICSSSAPHYVIDAGVVEKAMTKRARRPLIFVDISMPRNIDPKIALLDNVSLYHIDDLETVVEESMLKRQAAVNVVKEIITAKIDEFYLKIEKTGLFQTSDM